MAESYDGRDGNDEEEEEDIDKLDKRKKMYTKEVRCMLYGFGDDENPYQETVNLLDEIVVQYIIEMTKMAAEVGKTDKVTVEDILFLVRRDSKKYSRVKDLLHMNEELKKARKAFDEVKYQAS